jgi:hypothetical protein
VEKVFGSVPAVRKGFIDHLLIIDYFFTAVVFPITSNLT